MSLPDYVQRRAEILAELFLRDLNPKFLAQATFQGAVWDYMAAFQTKKGRLVNITVEVKPTEHPIAAVMAFGTSARQAEQLTNSNMPVLILIVDVKNNSLAWNWASKAKVEHHPQNRNHAVIRLPVIKGNPDAVRKLLAEIETL